MAGDEFCFEFSGIDKLFQSTPAYGGRPKMISRKSIFLLFQSTPAYGGRLDVPLGYVHQIPFQSTPAYGGRPSSSSERVTAVMFQSTPAYGGRPPQGTPLLRPRFVSIHARVWRATYKVFLDLYLQVFQSTPAYGGRHTPPAAWQTINSFNPRPRMAGDWRHFWSSLHR